MSTPIRPALKLALVSVALSALIPLAACNQADRAQSSPAQRLPDLPATMPLALGDERPVTYAPAAQDLPRVHRIPAARITRPDDYYAWADDAWDYDDALGYAPPDYGFYYDDIEPWAWQGYDDSLMFIEPIAYGYRYYYYRPGEEYPYFIRDPDCGYGYNDGRLAVIYDAGGAIIPYDRYYDGPRLDYASSYYDRGYRLYQASIERHPVIAANWYAVQPSLTLASTDWSQNLWRQPQWQTYHQRALTPRESYWQPERERRQAEAVRYAAWQEGGFQSAPPPRAIPRNWKRADWARNERLFAPPVSGFDGDTRAQQRAALREQQRVASLVRETSRQDQPKLAALRERVGKQPAIDSGRIQRMADMRQQLERRQAQLASRDDRAARQERALVENQQRSLARAQQDMLRQQAGVNRHDRGGGPDRLAALEQSQQRQQMREQRLNEAQVQQEQRQRFANGQRQQAELQARAHVEQRRQLQAQVEVRQQHQEQIRAEANARSAQREQARQAMEQGRAAQEQGRQAAQQRFEQQRQAREQARQAGEQQRQAREQARQAVEQQRQARDQARQAGEQQRAAQQQARQAAEQQRAAQQQAQQQTRAAAQQERIQRQQQQQEQVAQANSGQSGGGDTGKGHGRGPH